MVENLAQQHRLPVLSIHAPCLLITQRVWPDPWERLTRTVDAARRLAHRPSSSTRRSVGSVTTPGVSCVASPTWRRRPASRSRSRTCTRGARPVGRSPHTPPTGIPPTSPTRTTRWTSRTPPCPARTPWPWPTRSETDWLTFTSPTAPARHATSTWFRAAATSPGCCAARAARSAGLVGRDRGRGRHQAGADTGRARGRPCRGAGLRTAQPGHGTGRHGLRGRLRRHRRAGAPRVRTMTLLAIMSGLRPAPTART